MALRSMPLCLAPHGLWPTRLLCPWDSPGKNTGVGYHFLLQGNLPHPGIKPSSPAMQADSLPSEPPGKSLYDLTEVQTKSAKRITYKKADISSIPLHLVKCSRKQQSITRWILAENVLHLIRKLF